MVAPLTSAMSIAYDKGVGLRGALIRGEYEEYHPYGTCAWWAEKSGIQVSRKRYRYTGQEKDDETGLGYHHHRYYVPWLGRWASADPAGLVDGGNRYRYGRGSPASGRDGGGLSTEKPADVEQPAQEEPPTRSEESVKFTTESGVAITITSSASGLVEHEDAKPEEVGDPALGASTTFPGGGWSYSTASWESNTVDGRLVLRLRSIDVKISRRADVYYVGKKGEEAPYGTGSTLHEHEVEGHYRIGLDFRDPSNLETLLTSGLSQRSQAGKTVEYRPLDIPAEFSFPAGTSEVVARSEAGRAVGAAIVGYIQDVNDFWGRIELHGKELPTDKTITLSTGERWTPYDQDEFGSLFLREYAPAPPQIKVKWE